MTVSTKTEEVSWRLCPPDSRVPVEHTEGETGYPMMLQYRHFNKLLVVENFLRSRILSI